MQGVATLGAASAPKLPHLESCKHVTGSTAFPAQAPARGTFLERMRAPLAIRKVPVRPASCAVAPSLGLRPALLRANPASLSVRCMPPPSAPPLSGRTRSGGAHLEHTRGDHLASHHVHREQLRQHLLLWLLLSVELGL
jgi:hypothetical protein